MADRDLFAICRKYQFMEVNTQRRAAGLKDKIPDIHKTLEMIRFLKTRSVSTEIGCMLTRLLTLLPNCMVGSD